MAATLSVWQQDAIYDPTNPNQISRVQYAGIPGGYASYYYSRVPTPKGTQLLGVLDSMPGWASVALIGVIGLGVGYFGTKIVGPKLGHGPRRALSGARARRRR